MDFNPASRKERDFNPASRKEQDFRLPIVEPTLRNRISARLVMLTTPSMIRGVDLSHWNEGELEEVDFFALKASGIEFVILKATEGISWVDNKFEKFFKKAHEAGLLIMTYHFFRSQYGGAAQAKHHRDTLSNLGFFDLVQYKSPVMWADVETADGASVSQRQNRLLAFHQTVTGMGYQSGHYSSPYLWNQLIGNVSWASDYTGWGAHWTSASVPTLPAGWTRASMRMWQNGIYPTHSWVEPVNGTPGAVDHNYFYGTLQDMKDWLGAEVVPPPVDCCDELRAEIARLEEEINYLKLEVYNVQQHNISQDEKISNNSILVLNNDARISEIETWIQTLQDAICK